MCYATRVWHYFLGSDKVRPVSPMLDALNRAGIILYEVDPSAPEGQGVLFFDQVTSQLYDFLRETSRHGLGRVLAIALSQAALDSRGAWRLLQAGASDVFAWDHSTNPGQE